MKSKKNQKLQLHKDYFLVGIGGFSLAFIIALFHFYPYKLSAFWEIPLFTLIFFTGFILMMMSIVIFISGASENKIGFRFCLIIFSGLTCAVFGGLAWQLAAYV